jgi:hypothetical protein
MLQIRLGWRLEGARAICSGAPLCGAFVFRLRQGSPYAVGVEVCGIDRSARLLPPGFIDPAGVHSIEPELVGQA